MADLSIRVDSRAAIAALARLGDRGADGRVPLGRFYQGYRARVLTAWNQMRAGGGVFRGEFIWPKMADQYTRKTDGVTVPIYGGVKRIERGFRKATRWASDIATLKTERRGVSTGERMSRVSGNVSGKLRKSGTRWTQNSVPLADTGELRAILVPPRPRNLTKRFLRIGGSMPSWQAALVRRFSLLEVRYEDQAALNTEALNYAREIADEFNGKKGAPRA